MYGSLFGNRILTIKLISKIDTFANRWKEINLHCLFYFDFALSVLVATNTYQKQAHLTSNDCLIDSVSRDIRTAKVTVLFAVTTGLLQTSSPKTWHLVQGEVLNSH